MSGTSKSICYIAISADIQSLVSMHVFVLHDDIREMPYENKYLKKNPNLLVYTLKLIILPSNLSWKQYFYIKVRTGTQLHVREGEGCRAFTKIMMARSVEVMKRSWDYYKLFLVRPKETLRLMWLWQVHCICRVSTSFLVFLYVFLFPDWSIITIPGIFLRAEPIGMNSWVSKERAFK